MNVLNLSTHSIPPFSQIFEDELLKKFKHEVKLTSYREMTYSH